MLIRRKSKTVQSKAAFRVGQSAEKVAEELRRLTVT